MKLILCENSQSFNATDWILSQVMTLFKFLAESVDTEIRKAENLILKLRAANFKQEYGH